MPSTAFYAPGATPGIAALPSPGYAFVNWAGAPVANPALATTTITMSNEYNLTANFAPVSPAPGPVDVSSQVQVTVSNPSSLSGSIFESITITNTSAQYLTGPVSVVLTGLSPGFTLTNATWAYNGGPYIQVIQYGFLAPGNSYTAFLQFSVGPTAIIQFTPKIYAGL